MVNFLRVAKLDIRHRCVRQIGLDLHDRLGVELRFFWRLGQELERPRDVRHVLRSDLFCPRIVAKVIVALGKSQP